MYLQIEVLSWLEKTDNIALVLAVFALMALGYAYKRKDSECSKVVAQMSENSQQTIKVLTASEKVMEHLLGEVGRMEQRLSEATKEEAERVRDEIATVREILLQSEHSKDEKRAKKADEANG